tara:strand:+ start:431 stop:697 length:267 start_codon:yes stop_codon:yes gene_type:complete
MKVIILQRAVYNKTAEIEISIPNNINKDDIQQYLSNNEELWYGNLECKTVDAELDNGLGMYPNQNWKDTSAEFEVRFECDELKIGGHL